MTNSVHSSDGELRCSCGAKCSAANSRKRFLKRHPKICSERRDFTRQLAQGTRSVEAETGPKHMIDAINSGGRNLTPWEKEFVGSITEQFDERAWLTDKQREILERIYEKRT